MTEHTTGLDIIGDVHGKADKLHALLKRMGYHQQNGVWSHPQRRVLFIGDLIDNGHQSVQTLTTVRNMVEHGSALAIMGNHELNAVGYATRHSVTGEYLRAHNDANTAHHQAFLDDIPSLAARAPWLEWFKTLPLFLDFGNVRFIHACWHPPSFAPLAPYLNGDNSLRDDAWEAVFAEDTAPFQAVENLLKGIEIPLPNDLSFLDHKGKRRYSTRISWWLQHAQSLRDMVHIPDPGVNAEVLARLAEIPADEELLSSSCYQGDCPVFFGHYWLKGEPSTLTDRAACVDYSAGKEGPLVAYRWDGEQQLSDNKFIY
jgi:hypothetical protein